MDSEFKKLLAGESWAEDGDRVDPESSSILPTIDRSIGFPVSYSSTNTPARERLNQIFRELYAAAKAAGHGPPQYDPEVAYPVGGLTQINGVLFYASVAHDPDNPVNPLDENQSNWETIGSRDLVLRGVPNTIQTSDIYIVNNRADRFSVFWVISDNGGYPITETQLQYSKDSTFSTGITTVDDYTPGDVVSVSNRDSDLIFVRLRFRNTIGWSSFSSGKQVRTTPLSPNLITGIEAIPRIASGRIRLKWKTPSDNGLTISSYTVYARLSSGGTFSSVGTPTGSSTQFDIDSLTNDSSYDFKIVAHSNRSTTRESSVISATPVNYPKVPSTPTITVVAETTTSVRASVVSIPEDNGSRILSFQFQSKDSDEGWSDSTTVSTTGMTVEITGVSNGTTKDVRVRAYNGIGDSDGAGTGDDGYSAWSSVGSSSPIGILAPPAPSFSVARRKDGSATYFVDSEIDSDGSISKYRMQYKESDENDWETAIETDDAGSTITGLDTTKNYDFQMSAYNDEGWGNWSSTVTSSSVATVPNRVPFFAKRLPGGSIEFGITGTFDDGGDTITGYIPYYQAVTTPASSTIAGTEITVGYGTIPASSLDDTKSYNVQFYAKNNIGTGSSNQITVPALGAPPKPPIPIISNNPYSITRVIYVPYNINTYGLNILEVDWDYDRREIGTATWVNTVDIGPTPAFRWSLGNGWEVRSRYRVRTSAGWSPFSDYLTYQKTS